MGIGDEGSRCAMAYLIREPADQRGAMRKLVTARGDNPAYREGGSKPPLPTEGVIRPDQH